MSENLFNAGVGDANIAFGVDCQEEFEVLTGGTEGPLMALSIDAVTNETRLAPGGAVSVGDVVIFILKSVFDGADVMQGAKLLVRGKRFRVNVIDDDGDNCYMVTCGPTGVVTPRQ